MQTKQVEAGGFAVELCAVEHRLGRDTAAVQAGAANLTALNQSGGKSQLGSADGSLIAAGASADDNKLKFVHSK